MYIPPSPPSKGDSIPVWYALITGLFLSPLEGKRQVQAAGGVFQHTLTLIQPGLSELQQALY